MRRTRIDKIKIVIPVLEDKRLESMSSFHLKARCFRGNNGGEDIRDGNRT